MADIEYCRIANYFMSLESSEAYKFTHQEKTNKQKEVVKLAMVFIQHIYIYCEQLRIKSNNFIFSL